VCVMSHEHPSDVHSVGVNRSHNRSTKIILTFYQDRLECGTHKSKD
jgi:phage terminase large subunit-like protein